MESLWMFWMRHGFVMVCTMRSHNFALSQDLMKTPGNHEEYGFEKVVQCLVSVSSGQKNGKCGLISQIDSP